MNNTEEEKYVIDRKDYYDEYGKKTSTCFYIKYLKSFYGLFEYWKYITHISYDTYDRTSFRTEKKAILFIKEILCPGRKYNGWTTTTVNEITCT